MTAIFNQLRTIALQERVSIWLLRVAMITFFLADGVTKYLQTGDFNNTKFSMILRGLFFFLCMILVILTLNRRKLLVCIFSLYTLVMFIVARIVLLHFTFADYNFGPQLAYFFKTIYIFMIYAAFQHHLHRKSFIFSILPVFEFVVLFNSLLCIFGLLFDVPMLHSYNNDYRFGFNGFVPAVNESTFFYAIALFYFYDNVQQSNKYKWKMFLLTVACLINGAKGVYVSLATVAVYHVFSGLVKMNIKTVTTTAGFVIGVPASLLWLFPQTEKLFEFFSYAYNKYGFFTMMLSNRNTMIADKMNALVYSKWTWFNFLFGGNDVTKIYFEMELFDLFIIFGVINAFVFFTVYITIFFRVRSATPYQLYFYVILITLAFAGGHFFASAVNSLYLLVVYFYFLHSRHRPENSRDCINMHTAFYPGG